MTIGMYIKTIKLMAIDILSINSQCLMVIKLLLNGKVLGPKKIISMEQPLKYLLLINLKLIIFHY